MEGCALEKEDKFTLRLSTTGELGVMDEQGCASTLRTGELGRSFSLRRALEWIGHGYTAFAWSWRACIAFFRRMRSLIFRYWETQATLLMTMTATASPTMESISMVLPPL